MASRILTFKTMRDGEHKLKKSAVLILTFEPLNKSKLYKDQFPVIWKRIILAEGQSTSASIEYTGKLGVATTTTGNDVVYPGPFVDMKPGQSSALSVDQRSEIGPAAPLVWSDPTPLNPISGDRLFSATNKTGYPKDISVGLITEEFKSGFKISGFQPVLTCHNLDNNYTLSIEFTPRLKIYSYSNYKETQIIRAEVENCLGTYDLLKLSPPENTGKENIFVVYTDETGGNSSLTVKGLDDVDKAKIADQ